MDRWISDHLLTDIEQLIRLKMRPSTGAVADDHLRQIVLSISEITPPIREGDHWIVNCLYSTALEAEFTIYPDNPAVVKAYHTIFRVDSNGRITEQMTTGKIERADSAEDDVWS